MFWAHYDGCCKAKNAMKKPKTNKQRESKFCQTIKMIRIINVSQVTHFHLYYVFFLSASKRTTEGKKEHHL